MSFILGSLTEAVIQTLRCTCVAFRRGHAAQPPARELSREKPCIGRISWS